MNYKKIYTSLIEKRKIEPFYGEYFEKHHIIPRSLGGSDDESNLVCLSAREHYLAHALLVKIYKDGSDEQNKMLWAFNGMRNLHRDYQERIVGNSHLYASLKGKYKHSEKTKEKMSASAMGHIVTDETRNKLSKKRKEMYIAGTLEKMVGEKNPMYGKELTDEHKMKMSKALKGKKLNLSDEERERRSERFSGEKNPMYGKTMSEEHKEKIRSANRNKKYTEEMRSRRSELSSNKIHINDGVDGKFVTQEEFSSIWKPKGWKLGMKPRKKKL